MLLGSAAQHGQEGEVISCWALHTKAHLQSCFSHVVSWKCNFQSISHFSFLCIQGDCRIALAGDFMVRRKNTSKIFSTEIILEAEVDSQLSSS